MSPDTGTGTGACALSEQEVESLESWAAATYSRRVAVEVDGRQAALRLALFGGSVLVGVVLRVLTREWPTVGPVAGVAAGVAGVGVWVLSRSWRQVVALSARPDLYAENLTQRLDRRAPHVARAVREARQMVQTRRWRQSGVYLIQPACPPRHSAQGPCAQWACSSVAVVRGLPVGVILVGRWALAGSSDGRARAVLLHEVGLLRGWRPVAWAAAGPLAVIGPALAAWTAPPAWAAVALFGVYLAVLAAQWTPGIVADLGAARRVDPRDVASAARDRQRRARAARRRGRWLVRAAAVVLPAYPPIWLRVRLANNRVSRWGYYRKRERRQGRQS